MGWAPGRRRGEEWREGKKSLTVKTVFREGEREKGKGRVEKGRRGMACEEGPGTGNKERGGEGKEKEREEKGRGGRVFASLK